jgi:hypothetical protein
VNPSCTWSPLSAALNGQSVGRQSGPERAISYVWAQIVNDFLQDLKSMGDDENSGSGIIL